MAMLDFLIRICLLSPTGTPWQSDTLFGHLCWQVALGRADLPIEAFLAPFLGGEPPFVFSDGFPSGLMPKPMLPYRPEPSAESNLGQDAQAAIKEDCLMGSRGSALASSAASHDAQAAGNHAQDACAAISPLLSTLAAYAAAKRARKSRWITTAEFQRLCRGELFQPAPVADPWRKVTFSHASLDRRNLRTGGEGAAGEFFESEAEILDSSSATADPHPAALANVLDLYLRAVSEEWAARAELLLREVARAGFGRDKSTGFGAFEVIGREPTHLFDPSPAASDSLRDLRDSAPNPPSPSSQPPSFPPPCPNGLVSLSSYVPAAGDPTDGFWRLRVKRGKLGEPGAWNAPADQPIRHPFKRPLLELEPGAVFRLPPGAPPRPIYGRMVPGLSDAFPKAVQCGYTLAVPCEL